MCYTFRISKVDCKNKTQHLEHSFLTSWRVVDECRPGSSLLFWGNLISFLPMNIVIAPCVLHGNLLDHLGKLLTTFGHRFSNMEIAAPVLFLDIQRRMKMKWLLILPNCRKFGSLSLRKSKGIDNFVFNVIGYIMPWHTDKDMVAWITMNQARNYCIPVYQCQHIVMNC